MPSSANPADSHHLPLHSLANDMRLHSLVTQASPVAMLPLIAAFAARPPTNAGLRCLPPLLLARRRSSRGNETAPVVRPRRELQRSPDGLPEIARCHPDQYDALLGEKVEALREMLSEAVLDSGDDKEDEEVLPPIEVFESPRSNFRMRANFQIWREGQDPEVAAAGRTCLRGLPLDTAPSAPLVAPKAALALTEPRAQPDTTMVAAAARCPC